MVSFVGNPCAGEHGELQVVGKGSKVVETIVLTGNEPEPTIGAGGDYEVPTQRMGKNCTLKENEIVELKKILGTDFTAGSTFCTLCAFTGNPKECADHNCPANPDDVRPNRFDPYEALDTMGDILADGLPTHTARGDGSLIPDEDSHKLERQIHALRAYITGMERWWRPS